MQPHRRQPAGSAIPGILQARTPEWAAISFSNAWKWKVKVKLLSRVRLLATPWTAAYQAPPSMGFSKQEYWSGVPLPSPSRWNSDSLKLLLCVITPLKIPDHCFRWRCSELLPLPGVTHRQASPHVSEIHVNKPVCFSLVNFSFVTEAREPEREGERFPSRQYLPLLETDTAFLMRRFEFSPALMSSFIFSSFFPF